MDKKEFNALVGKMKKELGFNDDQIMETLYKTFESGQCEIEDYELMVGWLGYELTDDFYKEHHIKKKK